MGPLSLAVDRTVLAPKRESWLKGTMGTPRYREGMVSGAKTLVSCDAATLVERERQ